MLGLPNSRWSVTDKGSLSSSKVVKTSRKGTFRIQALYNSGLRFIH